MYTYKNHQEDVAQCIWRKLLRLAASGKHKDVEKPFKTTRVASCLCRHVTARRQIKRDSSHRWKRTVLEKKHLEILQTQILKAGFVLWPGHIKIQLKQLM